MYAATDLGNLRKLKQSKHKARVEPPTKKDKSEAKQEEVTEEEYIEPIETPMKKGDCDLESKIEIEEDMMFKTESADLSEFVHDTNNDSIDAMTGHVDDGDESIRKEEEEEKIK